MLMVGSAGRNSGKTEFACAVIRKFGGARGLVGVKVTSVEERDGKCPRGGEGCGVCSTLEGNYLVTEEVDAGRGKDTERLAAAGAHKVYWLRVLKAHLEEGTAALLDRIGPGAIVICESNSLRTVVDPGAFLMFRHRNSRSYKASAEAVRKHADRIVTFSGHGLDLDLDDVNLIEDRWAIRAQATAIILAGGQSQRMGRDKSILPIEGRPIIEHIHEQLGPHFKQLLISANDSGKYAFLGTETVPDEEPRIGPIMGITSALEASGHDLNFVIACDMPDVNTHLIRWMLREAAGFDGVVLDVGNGLMEPLFAVYRKSMIGAFRKTLALGKRKVIDAFDIANIKYLDLSETGPLRNLNTREDYAGFLSHRQG